MKIFTLMAMLLSQPSPVDCVDPLIGSGGHGHVFVGASVPFGAVQAGPNNVAKGWDWCSGYHYSDSVLIGFSQTHLSGTGIGDLGDVLIMPYTGPVNAKASSHYSHARETVKPGYYAVTLDDYNIRAAMTATAHVTFHQYSFPQNKENHILVNLIDGVSDKAVGIAIRQVDDYTLEGYRFSKGWAADHRVWFAIKSNVPLKNDNGQLSFNSTQVQLKIGISPVSSEKALANIQGEIPGWDFAAVTKAARDQWHKALSKVKVKTDNDSARTIFYTALYHTMIAPSLYNDYGDDEHYSVFAMWDVYRSNMPLQTILQPDRVGRFVNAMLKIYKQNGKLPIWELKGNETNTMPGYGAIPVVADAILKGIKGFDVDLAFEAMKTSATLDEFGMKEIKEKGFVSSAHERESVSKAMEYALADWGIAAVAKMLGHIEDFNYFAKRAAYYKRYFDTSSRFVRPLMDDGRFKTPFDPFNSIHMEGDFAEGNAWQYTFLVPQDVEGLMQLMGGEQGFIQKMDSLFIASGSMGEAPSNDITGLIGMYAHGNEPSHHIAYMYAYAGQQWKTAEKVRQIMKEFYTTRPDGLAGNEDCGAMSSWYVLSSLGLYPVNPAKGIFVFGSPLFDKATIHNLTIEAINNSKDNIYIQSITLNGKPYTKSYITYADVMKGGSLKMTMGATPNFTFGQTMQNRPDSHF